ncbi:lasso peptide biosynthesis protein [Pseudazoarcus pumilus]|uniref:lasso peptide biosynthesis protein n=1 Tax=Pseudazoarcus pumilus TaxID=2067960 RepID=UPI0013DADD65|nr:lasso peptide biosynthesis protein [Pseudazoarcus pumilus]
MSGLQDRMRRNFHQPSDVWWFLHIGLFLWTVPRQLKAMSLPEFLERQSGGMRPAACTNDIESGVERIGRLQGVWLRRSFFRSRNTCYLRAVTLFRFLDAGDRHKRIHFAVEPEPRDGRRRGHAWISVDGRPLGVPDGVKADTLREIFVFPPSGDTGAAHVPPLGDLVAGEAPQ